MKLKLKLLSTLIILLSFVFAFQASTFKPFVRSRYSLRWRKTTEAPKIWDSSTAAVAVPAAAKEDVTKPIEESENGWQVTTVQNKLKTSTHMPDYDYYGNNELEEIDHKN